MRKLAGVALMSALVFGALSGTPGDAQAAGWYNCQAQSVIETGSGTSAMLMVTCSNNYSAGINQAGLLISTAAVGQPSRFVALADAAILAGRKFRVWMTDTACPSPYQNSCRTVTSWALYTL